MKNIKILVMGLPGSGKTTLSKKLVELIDAEWINADVVRREANDWDFSLEGRIRQALRIKKISDNVIKKGKHCVTDFICPTKKTREQFKADYIIWMNTISEGRFEDTNKMFENPSKDEVNFIVTEKNADKYKSEIIKRIDEYLLKI